LSFAQTDCIRLRRILHLRPGNSPARLIYFFLPGGGKTFMNRAKKSCRRTLQYFFLDRDEIFYQTFMNCRGKKTSADRQKSFHKSPSNFRRPAKIIS